MSLVGQLVSGFRWTNEFGLFLPPQEASLIFLIMCFLVFLWAKLAKKYIFFLSFWAKYDSCDVYLKYGLIQNRLCEKHF